MNQTAFVFPGQGSQHVGMGSQLLELCPGLVDSRYRPADDLLGIPLSTLCRQGPVEVLRETAITQPAVFLTSVATWDVLHARGIVPDVVAGHSLGEYAALVCAGVLEWTDALRLVRRRGELMAAVNASVPGSMAAVIGLRTADVERICARVAAETGRVVEVANDNEPGQAVVSGEADAVERVGTEAQASGALKVLSLAVGAPFHCALMAGIEAEFAAELDRVTFSEPRLPVLSSVTADLVATAAEAKSCLARQLTGRVRWTETVQRMRQQGVGRVVEAGPGRVLGGLSRRIEPGLQVRSTHNRRHLDATLADFVPAPATASAGHRQEV
ncbi:ACP S-malonyltransferase [Streptomyces longwoodensis]